MTVSNESVMTINGTEVCLQGCGLGVGQTVVMLHGWPDTRALWDGTVLALQDRFACARLTLPGFEQGPSATSLDEMCDLLRQIVDRISPDQAVVLLLHDWGCIFGYEFAMRHPTRVSRVVAVDVGDHNSRALLREWGAKEKLAVMGYQLWLAVAWLLGHRFSPSTGTRMTRAMARWLRCPTPPERISHLMNYPYAMQWLGAAGGFKHASQVKLAMPLLFVYGERKPFMFHSSKWLAQTAATPGSAVLGLPCGHWVMVSRPEAFHAAVRDWLDAPTLDRSAA
ncbi:alpha/beta fold hydrolase [Limnohabitans sp.]|uniref:alpha/beta fold hydrolase n=1 Tax=Limnohabitans sp. TaxID=1907725 RepID=UPI0037C0E888